MTYEKVYELICETLRSLQRSSVVDASMEISAEAVILGTGSGLDSLGFVSFISELEERLSVKAGEEIYLVLDDILEFNADSSRFTVDTLTRFIVKLTEHSEQ